MVMLMSEEVEMNQEDPQIRQLLLKIKNNQSSLHISGITPQVKKTFIALANSEFKGDYTMTLKWLMESISLDDRMDILNLRFAHYDERLKKLEEEIGVNREETIRLMNGSVIRRRKE